jgi:CxxC motif-containing protein (DUF1111 family)
MRTLLTLRLVVSVGVTLVAIAFVTPVTHTVETDEAPAGFQVADNGHAAEFCAHQGALTDSPNSPPIPDDECSFDAAAEEFTGPETAADGLGPVFNAAGCGECHLVPILGGGSQTVEKRAGYLNNGVFTDHAGGSLIQDRAHIFRGAPNLQEFTIPATPPSTLVTAFRGSISVLGDGFVEAIDSDDIEAVRQGQPQSVRGTRISVPVAERPGANRTGRFGWKNQQASLVSFSADAYKNEMGITSPLEPEENTSNGRSIAQWDPVPGEGRGIFDDEGVDVELFALFMRSTLAPPRDAALAASTAAQIGSNIFNTIGCAQCHTRDFVTAPAGTSINGGALRVTNALGSKKIHPFSDFLLHDIGTGDGIVQNGGAGTRNMVRTAPLWGLRVRSRFMHDNANFNLTEAILRHGNQGSAARRAFQDLDSTSKDRLLRFLLSL